jgi:hypothetical protein
LAHHRDFEKVRWQDEGTVTFRTVEPGGVDDDVWHVDCEVKLNPAGRITRVRSVTGDIRRVVVGVTMRCQFDRLEVHEFRAFPDAGPDAPLPSGDWVVFCERTSPG